MFDIIGAYFLLASGIVANKYALRSIAPDLLVGIRMAVSGIFLLGFSVRTSPRLRWSHIKHDIWLLLGIALGTTLVPALLKAYALSSMAASKQTLLGSIDPFITALYAYLMWRDPLTLRKLCGMTVGFMGIAISVADRVPAEQWSIVSLPEIAVIIAIALGRYGWMLVQMLLKKDRYLPTEITSLSMLLSGLCSLGMSCMRGSAFIMPAEVSWTLVSVLVYTTLIGNICGYTAYTYCLRKYHATLIATVGLVVPLFVAALSMLFGMEQLSLRFGIAFALVALGMLIFHGPARRSLPIL
jgi:drug/metabolite transporter (DMT)-like permease